MTLKHLPTMLSLSAIKFKKHRSSRYTREFNATTNALLSAEKKKAISGSVKA